MGFTFNGVHSDFYKIGVKDVTRSVKAEKRVFQTVIGGRDGTHDFTDDTYNNIFIVFSCDYKGQVMEPKNDIALWLSEPGELVLDEEPGKVYRANVYSEIPLTQLFVIREFELTFECFPFAFSVPSQVDADITLQGQETAFEVGGTARTPCVIILTNTGATPITNLRLTHRKEV